jgi:hypothetical protein
MQYRFGINLLRYSQYCTLHSAECAQYCTVHSAECARYCTVHSAECAQYCTVHSAECPHNSHNSATVKYVQTDSENKNCL